MALAASFRHILAGKAMFVPLQPGSPGWEPPSLGAVLRWPIPEQEFRDRCLIRGLTLLGRGQVRVVSGLQHVAPTNDPFIVALNHGTRREALLVPAILMLYRGGRLIHFLADWNFRLIPGIGLIYRRAQTITVTRKSARPGILDLLKPFYLERLTVLERARARLLAGMSVGIFPEGRVNNDRDRLLKGRTGAAYLSLQTGVPIVPAGIRLPDGEPGRTTPRAPLEIRIGAPLKPPRLNRGRAAIADLRIWHAAIMGEISRLSGKAWTSAR
jgi:1-acyl-sn-glycerol-3-phosphate acyltransferase